MARHHVFQPRSRFPPFSTRYTAHPKIIEGRFLLFSAWGFGQEGKDVAVTPANLPRFRICPHRLWAPYSGIRETDHKIGELCPQICATYWPPMVHRALQGSWSCDRCLTDYSISFQQNQVEVLIWQDSGDGGDRVWQSHISNEQNNEARGPTVRPQPCSIKEIYGDMNYP